MANQEQLAILKQGVQAWNQWQQEQAESARARVLGLADKAVQVVEKALERDNEKVAVGVLRHLGAVRRPPRGARESGRPLPCPRRS